MRSANDTLKGSSKKSDSISYFLSFLVLVRADFRNIEHNDVTGGRTWDGVLRICDEKSIKSY